MKNRNIFQILLRSISTRMIRFFLTLLVILVSMSLFSLTLIFIQSYRYNRKSCQSTFSVDLKHAGYMIFFENDDYEGENDCKQDFIDQVRALPEVENIGQSMNLGTKISEKLLKVQQGHQQDHYEDSNYIEVTLINSEMLNINPLKFSKKLEETQIDQQKEPMYLGAAYKNVVELGDTINSYQVAGFLEAGQKWVSGELSINDNIPEITSVYFTDWMIFVPHLNQKVMSSCQYFSLTASADAGAVQKKIEKIAVDTFVDLDYISFENMLQRQESMNKSAVRVIRPLFIFSFIVSVLMVLSMQIHVLYTNKREYGIMYSVGMSEADMMKMILLENVYLFFLAIVMQIPILIGCFTLYFESSAWTMLKPFVYEIYYKYSFPYTVLLAVALAVVISLVSSLIFRRITPVDMLRRDD